MSSEILFAEIFSALRANKLVTVQNHIVRFAAEDAAGLELLENDAAALNIDFDIKTAVSEAVTNAIIHGYEEDETKFVHMRCELIENTIKVVVEDYGKGIEDIEEAKQPMFTSKPELERSGMGFSFMESFMDDMQVASIVGEGTKVIMTKTIEVPK